jgi:hypothetical protein
MAFETLFGKRKQLKAREEIKLPKARALVGAGKTAVQIRTG